ncbi:MAG: glycoside hydrolase family 3 C-terminal domain-containing protein, partial [Promicromonosporaceae bacterium]|nr:glycoside hydrolase family 3 C-terminal domain-containing protein [Promicromonosporaceae bacterium]
GYFVSDGKAFEILPEFYGPFGYLGIDDDDWRAKWELSDDGETFRGKDGQEVNVKEVYARYAKAALDAGLDAFLAYDNDVVISAISKGVELGIIADADIERALVNQFQVMLRLGLVPGFGENPYANTPDEKLLSAESAELVKRASNEAVVLLNNDGLLPLTGKDAEKIAVIGFVAGENQRDWYSGSPAYQVTPLDGIRAAFPNAEVSFDDGCDLVAFSRSDIGWLRVLDDGAVRYDGTEEQRSVFRAIDWGYGHAFQDVSTGKYLTTTESGELRTDAETVWSWFNRQLFFINQANVYSRSDFHAHPDGLAGIALTGTVNIDGGQFHPEIAFGEPAFPPGAARPGKNQYLKPYEPGAVETLNEILAKLTIHVVESGLERAADIAGQADAAVVVLGNHPLIGARECVDRLTTALPARWGELFETVAQANPEVVLTLIAGYQYAIGRQEARARAVLFTSQGMQEVGSAIGETLSGANNPSGRLSQTWYADSMQFGSLSNYDISDSKLTYQYLDSEPLHEFGFGLSYTTFQYSDLLLTENAEGVTVSFTLTNTGERPGAEVVQVYLVPKAPAQPTETPRPRKSLVQFDRVVLQSGESAAVTLLIDRRELSFWNANTKTFEMEPGELHLQVGASSADIRLSGAVSPVGLH